MMVSGPVLLSPTLEYAPDRSLRPFCSTPGLLPGTHGLVPGPGVVSGHEGFLSYLVLVNPSDS